MDPVGWAYIVLAVLIAALAVIWLAPWFQRRRSRLDGWWHDDATASRLHSEVWRRACDESLKRARERR